MIWRSSSCACILDIHSIWYAAFCASILFVQKSRCFIDFYAIASFGPSSSIHKPPHTTEPSCKSWRWGQVLSLCSFVFQTSRQMGHHKLKVYILQCSSPLLYPRIHITSSRRESVAYTTYIDYSGKSQYHIIAAMSNNVERGSLPNAPQGIVASSVNRPALSKEEKRRRDRLKWDRTYDIKRRYVLV